MKRKGPPLRLSRFAGVLEELESRLLFNADAAALAGLDPMADPNAPSPQVQIQPSIRDDNATATSLTADASSSQATMQVVAQPVELVFVDKSVKDAQDLVASIVAQQDGSRSLEIHWLDSSRDGIEQISEVLQNRQNVTAIHLVTHGQDGLLELGATRLTADNLAEHAGQLSNWGLSMSGDADLMIYGCNVAETSGGQHFVADLGLLTGTDVAASMDATGAKSLGGDWDLEYHAGQIESAGLIQQAGANEWQGLLALTADGSETIAHTATGGTTEATLTNRQVASDSSGNFVVVYTDGTNLKAQRFNANGTTNGTALTVASSGTPTYAQVSMNATGAFVVTWSDASGVNFRTYTNAGVAGSTVQVAANGTGSGGAPGYSYTTVTTISKPSVAINSAGEIIVVYRQQLVSTKDYGWSPTGPTTDSIIWEAFTAAGAAQGSAQSAVVSSTTVGNTDPSIGMNGAGAFIVSYTDSSGNIYARRYSAARASLAATGDITGATGGTQSSAAMDSSGNYVIAYNDAGVIKFRVYSSAGAATTAVTTANTIAAGTPNSPSVVMHTNGGFSITWQNSAQDGSGNGVYMRQFAAAGTSADSDTRVNTTTANNQQYASVASTGTGSIIVWSGNGVGDTAGVFFQRFNHPNTAPVNTVPGQQTTIEDTAKVFSSGNGNQISIADTDAGSSSVRVTISVTNGALTLSGLTGLSFSVGDGTSDSTMTFTGTVANINTALNGLSYTPGSNFSGLDTLTIVTNDQGNSGPGGALSDTDMVTIRVTPANDNSVNNTPGTQNVNEDNTLVFSSGNGNLVSITDSDASSMQVTLTATNGTLTLSQTTGLTFSVGDGTSDATMTFTGSVADINAALAGMGYTPTANYNGAATITLSSQDRTLNTLNVDTSLKGRYTFESTGALGTDTSPAAGNGATPTSVTATNDATRGNVGSFSNAGSGSKLEVNGLMGSPTNVTVAAWVKVNTADLYGASIFTIGDSLNLVVDEASFGDKLAAYYHDGSGWHTTKYDITLAGTGWHHVAYSLDSTNNIQTLYLDGVAVSTTAYTEDVAYVNNTITRIGKFARSGWDGTGLNNNHNLDGALDEARIYNRALTSAEIASLATDLPAANTDTDVINVNIAAVNDAPVLTSNGGGASASVNVAENTSAVTTVTSTDVDAGATKTFSIVGGADSAKFSINSSTGVLTFQSAPNFESPTDAGGNNVYDVTVQVSDGSLTDTQAIAVTVTDVNEAPVITSNGGGTNASINVAENNTAVTTVTSTDVDAGATKTYSITGGADSAKFSINSSTGVLTFQSAPNYESPTDAGGNNVYDVIVQITDGALTDTQNIAVTVTDADEFDVSAVTDSNATANSVAENATNGSTVGITASASDADATTNTITYSLSDNAGGRFTINGSTGVVTVANGTLLNYEAATSHNITVLATSADGSTSSQSFTINLTDADEFNVGAVTDSNAAGNSVAENAANGSTVGVTATASDADGSTNTITYSLSNSAGGRFTINSSTGVVTVADGSLLNYEAATSHNITVLATSADASTSSQSFTINLSDVDEFDVGAVSDSNATGNSVAENAANGSTVGITAAATDADGTTNTITYSLSDNAGGRFTINSSTGVVTVANGTLLNYESATSHSITVLATSADASTSSQSFTINLSDVDEFNVGAVTDTNVASNSVAENIANGTAVGITASASDADGSTNTITYSLSNSAGGRFTINSSTGVVTVADGSLLNYEAATSHNITVLATSADGSTSSQSFTVNLTDVDEFDLGAVSDSNAAANSVSENASNGDAVGITASATDADGSNNTVTYTLSDNAGGRFTINASTGVVTVADDSLLDFETDTSHDITVLATSADGSTSSQTFTIQIADGSESGVGPISDTDAGGNTVAENAANGTVVGITAEATDPDVLDTITYTLSGDASGRFAINAATGVVTVANGTLLNRESAGSHDITVVATSTDGSSTSRTFTITVSDQDEFDVGVVTDSNAAGNSVGENAVNGTVVGVTAQASDADATTNTITYTLSDNAGGRFTINASTGVVTVANGTLLNYESATSHAITVLATSVDGSTNSQTFTINLSDVNEFDVGAVSDGNVAANSVAENAANGSTVGVTASASDADATTSAITYTLSDNAGGRFTINAGTGVVTVADGSLLNYETSTSHNITVLATSADGSTSSETFTINLTDVDEFNVGAVTDGNGAANSLSENAVDGSLVGITAQASDADGSNSTISYSLSDDAGGRFTIDAATGVVTVADGSLLNYEGATSHAITVLATSADSSTSSQTFTINLADVDEFNVGAVTDGNVAANSVAENVANGTAVGITGTASDADGSNSAITYSLSDSAGGRFTIDSSTGVVTVADGSLLNYETATSHAITILATSADGSTSSQTFTVNIGDVNEFSVGAVTDGNGAANNIAEDVSNGTAVGITAQASDADGSTNAITYSLSDSAGGRFSINASTGVVTVADASLLDYETDISHDITVLATSADGSTSNQTFTINLGDIDEFDVGAVSDANAGANTVAENAANGSTVGVTASATDADGTNSAISYTLSDDAGGRFAINVATGVVTVADGTLLDREAASSHTITVLATSADGSTSSQTFTINVADVDEFDISVVTDGNASANTLNENAANGTAVGITAGASDADATTNAITYTLSDSAGGRFAVNAATGVVTVADSSLLDYESATSHAITVLATSADGSTSSETFTITLSDVDEFDVGAVSDSNAGANTVAENAANGSTVGVTASATDADATNSTVSYSLSDDAGGRFTIDASTGVVTVADGTLLDREAAASHNITVLATSADGSTSSQTITINLSDVDEFDIGAVGDADMNDNVVDENATNGTTVGIVAGATDADATTSGITYTLSDNAGGRFTIDASTGVVTVANGTLLNREAAASHNITVLATSADGSTSSQTFTIAVDDVDEFDVGAVTDGNAAANTVAENAANGTTVGITAGATDADATTNTVTYSLFDDAGGRFTIDATTGVVTVADGSLLDREAAASYNIIVVANSDDGSTTNTTFTINLSDVDEFDVGAVSDSNAGANTVAENAANGSTVGVTASATDADATTNTVSYTLSDNAGGRFTIHASTGVVTVADGSLLNREAAASHTITVLATSADGSTNSQTFTINVGDVDEFDVGAVTDGNAGANTVAENAANGSTVGVTASASDADATTNTITYTLSDTAGGRFAINASTGVVTVANGSLLNYESATSHTITVLATSADGSTSSQTFTINLSDVDEFDVGAVSDSNAAANTVAENAANGSTVGVTAQASDADATTNTITYTLSDNAGGRFAINASTGVVTVANGTLLDREAAASHTITVLATSADGSTSSQTFTINLSDVDESDVGAVTDGNASANTVAENAANGSTVGVTASATDADATNNAIGYTLSDNAGGRFAINASTGVVTVANGTLLDREAAASHTITVVATSADGSTNSQTFTINIGDVDEFDVGAVTDGNATANAVNENAANGSTVGITAGASDADATTNTITYTLSDTAGGRFTINASTGVVTVANGSLLNYESTTSHTITVLATGADGSTSSQTFTINLGDVDEFDVGAVSDGDATANTVSENAANGSTVGVTATATDADATTNTVSYALSDNAGGRFFINAGTGVVTVANGTLLDREAAASHTITVVATSADGSTSTQTFTINLGDVDESDIGAVTDGDATANAVNENAANGSTVGITATATDADATTSTVTYTLSDNAGGRFAINASTGVVTVANGSLLNYESATSHTITVLATSADGSTSSQTFVINLGDADEFDVGVVSDGDAAANAVNENAANGSTVGITAGAADADATTNTVTYTLSDNAGGRFAINASTGVVTVADGSLLDREAAASHTITVVATSADGSTSSQAFTINLGDVDEADVGAISDGNATANAVNENAANGSTVGITANATDADATTNTVSYSLSDNAGGRFAINASTGVITVANGSLLDHESATSHAITVVATSADGSTVSQTFNINVSDVDEFDVGAVTDGNATANVINENAANGALVGITANATDADATTNTVTYTLSDNAGGRFTIDASTGVVSVADGSLLNYEAATSHTITAVATSADGSTSTQTFTINLGDVNEFAVGTVGDGNATADSVYENAANGTLVGITAGATDADATTNAVTYTLSDNAGGRFAINASTGVVTVANGTLLDREAAASHSITVLATSADGSSSTMSFTVVVQDVNDTAPTLNAPGSPVMVAERTTTVTTLSASDADASSATMTYMIIGGSDASMFNLDSATGALTFRNAPNYSLPADADRNNRYEVMVQVSDGAHSSAAMLYAEIEDQPEPYFPAPPPPAPSTPAPAPEESKPATPSEPPASPSAPTPVEESKGNNGTGENGNPTEATPGSGENASGGNLGNSPLDNALLPTGAGNGSSGAKGSDPSNASAANLLYRFQLNLASDDNRIGWLNTDIQLSTTNALDSGPTTLAQLGIPASGLSSPAEHLSFVDAADGDDTTSALVAKLPQATKVSGLAMSVGTVWWAARASGLIASMVVSAPVWRGVDPLPVLFDRDDPEGGRSDENGSSEEALAEQMFDSQSTKNPFEAVPIG
jgi:hypothetical protein